MIVIDKWQITNQDGNFLYFKNNLTAMNQSQALSDSYQISNIISKMSPKQQEQAHHQPPTRSRFTILSDFNEINSSNKNGEDQSLLTKYLRDLHQQQTHSQKQIIPQPVYTLSFKRENAIQAKNRDLRKQQTERIQPGHKRADQRGFDIRNRRGSNQDKQRIQINPNSWQPQHSRSNKINNKQTPNQFIHPGIYIFRKKIDLNNPIEYLEQIYQPKQNFPRNFGNFKNSIPSTYKERGCEDMLFSDALRSNYKKNRM